MTQTTEQPLQGSGQWTRQGRQCSITAPQLLFLKPLCHVQPPHAPIPHCGSWAQQSAPILQLFCGIKLYRPSGGKHKQDRAVVELNDTGAKNLSVLHNASRELKLIWMPANSVTSHSCVQRAVSHVQLQIYSEGHLNL